MWLRVWVFTWKDRWWRCWWGVWSETNCGPPSTESVPLHRKSTAPRERSVNDNRRRSFHCTSIKLNSVLLDLIYANNRHPGIYVFKLHMCLFFFYFYVYPNEAFSSVCALNGHCGTILFNSERERRAWHQRLIPATHSGLDAFFVSACVLRRNERRLEMTECSVSLSDDGIGPGLTQDRGFTCSLSGFMSGQSRKWDLESHLY